MARRIRSGRTDQNGNEIFVVGLTKKEIAAVARCWVAMNLTDGLSEAVINNLQRIERHLFDGSLPSLRVVEYFISNAAGHHWPVLVARRHGVVEGLQIGNEVAAQWRVPALQRAEFVAAIIDAELAQIGKQRIDLIHSVRFNPIRGDALRIAGLHHVDRTVAAIRDEVAAIQSDTTDSATALHTRLDLIAGRLDQIERTLAVAASTATEAMRAIQRLTLRMDTVDAGGFDAIGNAVFTHQ